MVSKYLGSSTSLKGLDGEQEKEDISGLQAALSLLKKQIQASRITSIKDTLVRNGRKLQESTSQMSALARSRKELHSLDHTENKNTLLSRTVSPLGKISGCDSGFVDKESISTQEELSSSVIMFSNNSGGNFSIQLTKLPLVEKIPPYSTWIFLARNQRMADDQSVVGRRQIYYDQHGGETLICSDSDVEIAEPEEEKHDFSEGEDQILWKALHDYGTKSEVFDILSQFLDATPSEILERYDILLKKYHDNDQLKGPSSPVDNESEKRLFLDRPLTTALDSFDNLFCRRCLIFDCRLHGCSESSVVPHEKQLVYIDTEDIGKPCGDYCYRLRSGAEAFFSVPSKFDTISKSSVEQAITTDQIDVQLNVAEGSDCNEGMIQVESADGKSGKDESIDVLPPDVAPGSRLSFTVDRQMLLNNSGKRRVVKPDHLLMGEPASDIALRIAYKKQKTLSPNAVSAEHENSLDVGHGFTAGLQHLNPTANVDIQLQGKVTVGELSGNLSKINIAPSNTNSAEEAKEIIDFTQSPALGASNSCLGQTSQVWSTLEKDLFLKGLEIFGRSSCLIARNLLSGLKTCDEVSKYMLNDEVTVLKRSMLSNSYSENNATDPENLELEQPTRTRIWRRRGRTRKLKYTWKSAIHPSIRKRIADGKEQCRKYVPCGCQQMCGKQCPCHQNGTCCEKYCRCSKSCKNRFRGCHCAKSQCRSRQCPCFAVGRECDPDVCRNCWVSCGDGSLGEPPARGDGYQCGNMKLLLKQQQRILLGRSDVAGWGAFLKNPVNKNDYLGEYTGELISHKEADKRGKIYDRANSSFLFDLNDQCVLDAYRKGDKLKFANHSSNPNCYAKVMLVAGDHRVGIFAKEHIEASEELFYDYRYGPDQAPAWARKPEGSKRDDYPSSQSRRAHKVA